MFEGVYMHLFLCRPIVMCAGAVILLCGGPKFDKTTALAADAVFKAFALAAYFKPAGVFAAARFDIW